MTVLEPKKMRRAARIHVLPTALRQEPEDLRFLFRIDNRAHIERAYGAQAARIALSKVLNLVIARVGDEGSVTLEDDGTIAAVVRDQAELGTAPSERQCQGWMQDICAACSFIAIDRPEGTFHVALTAVCAEPEDWAEGLWGVSAHARPLKRRLEGRSFAGGPLGYGEDWIRSYRRDMAAAAAVFAELRKGFQGAAVMLAWQPICDARDPSRILYHEAFLRLRDDRGIVSTLGLTLRALERLGLARALDRHVVATVIAELQRSPQLTLGVNISAQSATADGMWNDVEETLARAPEVAERLMFEITETAAMASVSETAEFVSRMRRIGCRVAIDDFGAGFSSLRQILALAPDIVKIDAFFLARTECSEADASVFRHLVGLANALVPAVVIEGVETEVQAELAAAADGVWQQGIHWAAPSL